MVAKAFDIPGLGKSSDRPQPVRGVDLRRVELSPVEAFVLSRVDGHASFAEICAVSGLGNDATLAILRKLLGAGLVTAPNASPPAPTAPSKRAPSPAPTSSGRAPSPPPAARTSILERLDDGSPVAPAELAGGPDLPEATRARIVRIHRRLASLSPHELLGVAPDADGATVKKAYFAASKELHPDRFYGKDVGRFRELIGDVFKAVANALETLSKRANP